ncbi:MAG: EscU/YscU/HrcU family type III secretion system export apparatus switch protein [Deltaproteobacteria bacterium]|nr:EscU/YscU/HrcU family type III secretion system export apparatus switch protein [Deltaproteobacteria bacterium]
MAKPVAFGLLGDTGEKTEEASPEKLRKAREEGQVPKSQDFVSALGFTAGFMTLAALFGYVGGRMKDFTLASLDAAFRAPTLATIAKLSIDAVPFFLITVIPVGGVVFVSGIFSNVLQTGFFLAFKAIIPKLDKINPINALKGYLKLKKFVELLKNVLKMAVVGYLAYAIMRDALTDMVLIVAMPFHVCIDYAQGLVWDFFVKICLCFILIGGADLLYARKTFSKEMMMSKYDVKQEYKQMEGDPHTKGERKRLAHELLFSGSMENVKNADAVVVNPTHIAVAIKYDKDKAKAPTVVAKGQRRHAEKIKELAKHYNVPILRNVPLAQALDKLEIGEEVPEDLYEAVAEVLAFVFKLKEEQDAKQKARNQKGAKPREGGSRAPKVPEIASAPEPAAPPPSPRGANRLKK